MAERIELLQERLTELDEKFKDAIVQIIYATLETTLHSCQGTCLRALYPRKQWKKIPMEFRKPLGRWIAEAGSYGRCTTCYRQDVRDGKIKTIRSASAKILSDEELLTLRKQVGLIK